MDSQTRPAIFYSKLPDDVEPDCMAVMTVWIKRKASILWLTQIWWTFGEVRDK
jgi:hypothetical protein